MAKKEIILRLSSNEEEILSYALEQICFNRQFMEFRRNNNPVDNVVLEQIRFALSREVRKSD